MKYEITEKDGTYTATIPLPLIDGRTLLVQGSASVGEVCGEFDFPLPADEVGWFGSDLFKGVGKVFKGIAKSKAIKKAVKIAKDVVKNPITTAALGVVTGGAAVPALTAANAAIRIAEAAKLGGSKGQAARKVIKASLKAAGPAPAKPPTPPAWFRGAIQRSVQTMQQQPRSPDPIMQQKLARLRAAKARLPLPPRVAVPAARVPDLLVKLEFAK